jgi:uncharacterized membrane protein YtjA (UPF0391 family)
MAQPRPSNYSPRGVLVVSAALDPDRETPTEREELMLRWALIFFVVALIAGILGFFGIAAAAAGIAKILFFVFLVLFMVSLVSGLMSRA